MKRPQRQEFASLALYEEARSKYVEFMLGAGGRLAGEMRALRDELLDAKKRIAALEQPAVPVEPPPLSLEEQVQQYAHKLIVDKYSAIDQLNITRAATRLGAGRDAHVALDRMDEWIEAVRLHCAMILAEVKVLNDEQRAAFDISKGWPKEA